MALSIAAAPGTAVTKPPPASVKSRSSIPSGGRAPKPITPFIDNEWQRIGVQGDFGQILTELGKIRESGLAFDLNEHTDGICAIGFAFKDWVGDLHAISVPVPATRFESRKNDVEAALKVTAKNIKKMMANAA